MADTRFLVPIKFGASSGPSIIWGSGSPESSITANSGSLFLRDDGSTGATLYIKETGDANNTGWSAVNPGTISLASPNYYLSLAGSQITPSLINLASHVTGTLTVTNGGTGLSTLTGSYRLLYSTDASTLTTLAPPSAKRFLTQSSGAAAPSWGQIASSDIPSGSYIVNVPATTVANTIAPTVNGVTGLTVKQTSGGGSANYFKVTDANDLFPAFVVDSSRNITIGGNVITLHYDVIGSDPNALGAIVMTAYGGQSTGTINTSAHLRADGGEINTCGGSSDMTSQGGSGGNIYTYGGSGPSGIPSIAGNGGTISLIGGNATNAYNGGAAGGINTSGGNSDTSTNGASGGYIYTFSTLSKQGGYINTSATTASGGSIDTSDGGGSINTKGTGSIQLGVTGTRTTLQGSAATTNKVITLPNVTGTSLVAASTTTTAGYLTLSTTTAGSVSFFAMSGDATLNSSGVITLGTVPISKGGTNATTAAGALNNLLPSQTGNNGKYLKTDGSNASWATVSATAGGSTTQVQFNDSGSLGSTTNSTDFVYDKTNVALGIGAIPGNFTLSVYPQTYNTDAAVMIGNDGLGFETQPFINYVGTVGSDPTGSFNILTVPTTGFTFSIAGYVKVHINTSSYWMPFYTYSVSP